MAAVLAALLASVSAAPKVFILIGQSNMEGHGLVSGGNGTLEYAVKHHPSAPFPICNITEAAERREGCVAAGAVPRAGSRDGSKSTLGQPKLVSR